MAAQSLHILIMIFVFSAAALHTDSVWCSPNKSLQKDFCHTGFAVHARVLWVHDGWMPNVVRQPQVPYQVYTLKVMETFKGYRHVRNSLYNSNNLRLYTASKFWWTPVYLEKDTEYLMYGFIIDGNLYTNVCHWLKKWNNVTAEERVGLRTQYKKDCNAPKTTEHPVNPSKKTHRFFPDP